MEGRQYHAAFAVKGNPEEEGWGRKGHSHGGPWERGKDVPRHSQEVPVGAPAGSTAGRGRPAPSFDRLTSAWYSELPRALLSRPRIGGGLDRDGSGKASRPHLAQEREVVL